MGAFVKEGHTWGRVCVCWCVTAGRPLSSWTFPSSPSVQELQVTCYFTYIEIKTEVRFQEYASWVSTHFLPKIKPPLRSVWEAPVLLVDKRMSPRVLLVLLIQNQDTILNCLTSLITHHCHIKPKIKILWNNNNNTIVNIINGVIIIIAIIIINIIINNNNITINIIIQSRLGRVFYSEYRLFLFIYWF